MPYIKSKEVRESITGEVELLIMAIDNEGDLNFAITSLLLEYMKKKEKNYATLNTIMGVLSCVAREFYRRVIGPYENTKIKENGDIPGLSD